LYNHRYFDTKVKHSDIAQQATKVLLQLGLDGSRIIGSANPSFISGGRNFVGH